ncbi:hypothetical protein BT93_G0529 [Corymbia citriodora subsp. variegata]|nr:hypothetical protein BT93_G0529 [Corymbia citriodora subsp. variegata]
MDPGVYEAAKSGDFHSLTKIISENGDNLFHQRTPKGNNILHVAAQYQQISFIHDFLQHPSILSLFGQENYKGDTPLHVATKRGSHEMVRVFIDRAKALSQPDAHKELLRKQNSYQDTLLHSAVRGGCKRVVELLIEEDSQLCNVTNVADESPLYLAAHRRCSDIIEPILHASSSPSSYKGPKGVTALHVAMCNSLPGWEKILDKSPEVIREGDAMGWRPLHYAAYLGKVKEVELLLQRDTSVIYVLDDEGNSALHVAAFQGHIKVIDQLNKSCPDAWDIINTKGQTALHAAVIGGHHNIVGHIVKMPKREDLINEQDANGNTALHLAVHSRKYISARILARDKKVDYFATNKDYLTAVDSFLARKEVCLLEHYKAQLVHL